MGRILRPDKRIITTGQPTPSRPSVRLGLLPASPSISPGLHGRTLARPGSLVRLAISRCFLICLVLQVGLGTYVSIKPSLLFYQFVQPIFPAVLSSQVAREAGKHNTRTGSTTRLEVTRRCTVTRQVPGDAPPAARLWAARPLPQHYGARIPDGRVCGRHGAWKKRDDACDNTARSRRGSALARQHAAQCGRRSTAATHVCQHSAFPATMTQENREAGQHSASDRPSYQHLQFARYLSMAVFTRVLDSGAHRLPAAATSSRPVPSLIVLPRHTLRPPPPSRPAHTLLVTAKISHILAPFLPLGRRGGERLIGGDGEGLFSLGMQVTTTTTPAVSTHRSRTPLESFEIIDRHLQTVACSSCAY